MSTDGSLGPLGKASALSVTSSAPVSCALASTPVSCASASIIASYRRLSHRYRKRVRRYRRHIVGTSDRYLFPACQCGRPSALGSTFRIITIPSPQTSANNPT
ncbi:hypothetical protein HKD37_12G034451 [Glycine soja]